MPTIWGNPSIVVSVSSRDHLDHGLSDYRPLVSFQLCHAYAVVLPARGQEGENLGFYATEAAVTLIYQSLGADNPSSSRYAEKIMKQDVVAHSSSLVDYSVPVAGSGPGSTGLQCPRKSSVTLLRISAFN